jgi:hypothetical protein
MPNFVRWRLIFVGSSAWNLLHCHASGAYNFEVAPRFLENLCPPDLTELHGLYEMVILNHD